MIKNLFIIYYLCNLISLCKTILHTKGLFKYTVVYNMKAIKFYLLKFFNNICSYDKFQMEVC